jgi:hypothetical protein
MKLQLSSILNALLVATLATQATAFTVPEDLPDGFYSADIDSNGELIAGTEIKLLRARTPEDDRVAAELNSKRGLAPSRITPRVTLPPHHIICKYNQAYNLDHYDNALVLIGGAWRGGRIGNGQASFSKWNTAVIYMCSYDPNGSPAWKDEYMLTDARMNSYCGARDTSAYVTIAAWSKHYGRERAGNKICASQVQT